jgi:hypothetical membrane protein
MKNNNWWNKLLLELGPVSVLIFIINVIVFSSIRENYHHVSQTVSELGSHGSSLSLCYNGGIIIFGILLVLFSIGIARELKKKSKAGVGGLIIIGIVNITGGIFPLNQDQPQSFSNIVHTVSGLIMLFSYLISIPLLNRSIKKRLASSLKYNLLKTSWFAGAAGIGIMIFMQQFGIQGLGQRLFYLSFFSWIVIISASLLDRKNN